MKKGLVHIYTGKGKGKTTAAIGCCMRAAGHGLKVGFFQFLKGASPSGGELKALKACPNCEVVRFKHIHPGFRGTKTSAREIRRLTRLITEGLEYARKQAWKKKYDLLVLDEVLVAVRDKFIEPKQLYDFIERKPKRTELILTGRGATPGLTFRANYVTRMHEVKHPYKKHLPPRRGVEF